MTNSKQGTPLVIFEAMSLGLMIVAPRVGGIPEMVPPNTGVLIDNHCSKDEQEEKYAQAIRQVLSWSDKQRNDMQQAAATMAKTHYDTSIMANKLRSLMLKAQAENRKSKGWKRVDTWKKWPLAKTKFSANLGLLRMVINNDPW